MPSSITKSENNKNNKFAQNNESMKLKDFGLKDRLQNLMKITKLTKITTWQQKYQKLQNENRTTITNLFK